MPTKSKYFFVYFIAFHLFVASFFSCATRPENQQIKLNSSSEDYINAIELNTQKSKVYDGFMNVLDLSATRLTTKTIKLQVDQNARIYFWNEEQYKQEEKLANDLLDKETSVFLSFFIPEKKYDDLAKSGTKWRFFLDVNGRRFEGKATRLKLQLADLQNLYPHHTRWQTPYKITFPVSASLIENAEAKLTITGAPASTTMTFPTH